VADYSSDESEDDVSTDNMKEIDKVLDVEDLGNVLNVAKKAKVTCLRGERHD